MSLCVFTANRFIFAKTHAASITAACFVPSYESRNSLRLTLGYNTVKQRRVQISFYRINLSYVFLRFVNSKLTRKMTSKSDQLYLSMRNFSRLYVGRKQYRAHKRNSLYFLFLSFVYGRSKNGQLSKRFISASILNGKNFCCCWEFRHTNVMQLSPHLIL